MGYKGIVKEKVLDCHLDWVSCCYNEGGNREDTCGDYCLSCSDGSRRVLIVGANKIRGFRWLSTSLNDRVKDINLEVTLKIALDLEFT